MNKIVIGSITGIAVIGALVITPMSASAITNMIHGGAYGVNGSGNGLEIKAEAVDMTTDQLKEKLQTETISEIVTEQGMTIEQYQEKVQQAAQTHWQEMGLSDEEIADRTQSQTERQAECDGTGLGNNQYGRHSR